MKKIQEKWKEDLRNEEIIKLKVKLSLCFN
jgi:hypothetical protein